MAAQETTPITWTQHTNEENILVAEIQQPAMGRPGKLGADFRV